MTASNPGPAHIQPFAFDDLLDDQRVPPRNAPERHVGASTMSNTVVGAVPTETTTTPDASGSMPELAGQSAIDQAYARGLADGRAAAAVSDSENAAAMQAHIEKGVEMGRASAMESIAAADSKTLQALETALRDWPTQAKEAQAEDRATLLNVTRMFLAQFCGALAQERELDAVCDVLSRLSLASADDGRINLFLAKRSHTQLATKLETLLTVKGLSGVVDLQTDEALKPGECRMTWRGGAAQRGEEEIAAAVQSLLAGPVFNDAIDPQAIDRTNDSHQVAGTNLENTRITRARAGETSVATSVQPADQMQSERSSV